MALRPLKVQGNGVRCGLSVLPELGSESEAAVYLQTGPLTAVGLGAAGDTFSSRKRAIWPPHVGQIAVVPG